MLWCFIAIMLIGFKYATPAAKKYKGIPRMDMQRVSVTAVKSLRVVRFIPNPQIPLPTRT